MSSSAPPGWRPPSSGPPPGRPPGPRLSGRLTLILIAAGTVLVLLLGGAVALIMRSPKTGNAELGNGRAAQPGDLPPSTPTVESPKWTLAFSDEFNGAALDRAKWADESSAEADAGHGNPDNQQLEWNHAANCAVGNGELTMTAKREHTTSPSGAQYDWTSCLITSTPSFAFRYGYIEERAILPTTRGFWPAFWTWQAQNVNKQVETDVYEYYTQAPNELQLTQHSGEQGRCTWTMSFDPSAGWHVYAVSIEESGTTWYIDGAKVCHTPETSDGDTNLISNLAVYGEVKPARGTTTAVKRVDYIRAWKKK